MKKVVKRYRLAILLLGLMVLVPSLRLQAQQEISWKTLAGVTYEYVQNLDQNFWYGKATFSEDILALDGQDILIRGYILPLDFDQKLFYLSAYPYSACFFCGGAGQESIMELRLQDPKARFELDEQVTLRGRLRLNDRELELNYILEDARIYEEP
ncbi:MAG: DUF3299 domain-containing protein [Bacteroidetes bacterium]|nr:MAG: DUF3299 domain-containing protein [Bacteroidota bacterium]